MSISVPQAERLVKTMLRIAGRVVIDTGMPESSPDGWPSTEGMAIEWIQEALHTIGYQASLTRKA